MIIEGLLTTERDDGSPHVAPMGPVVDEQLETWVLRPFQTSTTFSLLQRRPYGIFHVVDDVLPVVQAALGFKHDLEFSKHPAGGWLIDSACHWYRLEIRERNLESPRSELSAVTTDNGVFRRFWGWNRAKHAVLEATILATRLHILDSAEVKRSLDWLKPAIDKTAGERERMAWNLVTGYIDECAGASAEGASG